MTWIVWILGALVWAIPSIMFGVFNGASVLGAIMFVAASLVLIRNAVDDV